MRFAVAFFLCLALLVVGNRGTAYAGDPDLVGLLALATDPEVSEELGLTEAQIERLDQLTEKREEAALELASTFDNQPGDSARDRLRAFRVESQRQMAAILTNDQLTTLTQLGEAEGNPSYEPMGVAEESPAPRATSQDPAAEQPPQDTVDAASQSSPAQPPLDQTSPEEPTAEEPSGEPQPAESPDEAMDEAMDDSSPEDTGDPVNEPQGGEIEPPGAEGADSQGGVSDGKLRFNFRYQPWKDVLDWFAEQADLSLVLEDPPSGTFNYTDSRAYTPSEALDVLNSVLLLKGYTLVRRDRMLVLVNLEDGVPPNLVTDIELEQLDGRAEYELVRVLFPVRNMTPAVAAEEVQKLVGPQGSVVVLPRAGMVQVTETAGRLRAIRDVIQAVEGPDLNQVGGIRPFELEHAAATEVIPIVRQMLAIEPEANATADGTLHVAIDTRSNARLLARGTPEMLKRLEEILKLVDAPTSTGGVNNTLQLEVYSTGQSDPDSVLLVMQALLAEQPGTRLTIEPQTGNLVALTTPGGHATISATLGQMQQDVRQVEVIPLATVDPQLAVLSITKLFGISSGEGADPRQPVIDADLSTRSLLVRASSSQIDQIRALLEKMGESEDSTFSASDRGNVRMLPLTASEARSAIEQLGNIWPTFRNNPIRMVTPATAIRAFRPADTSPHRLPSEEEFDWNELLPPLPLDSSTRPPSDRSRDDRSRGDDRSTQAPAPRVKVKEAVFQQQDPAAPADEEASPQDSTEAETPEPSSQPEATGAPSPILVAPGANGLVIASEDLEALDAYERLLEATTERALTGGGREYAVFYLKHAKAQAAAAILAEIFGGTAGGGDQGGLLGGIADAALGDIGGGLMGDLLGVGGGGGAAGFSAAGVDIVTDSRLNALIVYARPDDVDNINRLLQVIDQRVGPTDIEADGVARLIPVYNTSAAQVAENVKSVFSTQIEGAGGGQPNPQELLRALRGGGQGGAADAQEPAKMSIGVDTRSNSVIVRAPDQLFAQVEALVRQLDSEQLDTTQSTQIISLRHSNLEAVKAALEPIVGQQAITTTQSQGNQGGGNQNAAEAARRQAEMMRRIQQFQQRGGNRGEGRGGRGGGRGRGGRGR